MVRPTSAADKTLLEGGGGADIERAPRSAVHRLPSSLSRMAPARNPVLPRAVVNKITDDATPDVYVGSTTRGIERRMLEHIGTCLQGPTTSHPLYSLMRKWGCDRFHITTLDTFHDISRKDLCIEEGRWVMKIATLNTVVPGSMHAHWQNGTRYLMSMD